MLVLLVYSVVLFVCMGVCVHIIICVVGVCMLGIVSDLWWSVSVARNGIYRQCAAGDIGEQEYGKR